MSLCVLDTQTVEAGNDPISGGKVRLDKTIQKQGNHLGTLHNSVPSIEGSERICPEIRSIQCHKVAFGKDFYF